MKYKGIWEQEKYIAMCKGNVVICTHDEKEKGEREGGSEKGNGAMKGKWKDRVKMRRESTMREWKVGKEKWRRKCVFGYINQSVKTVIVRVRNNGVKNSKQRDYDGQLLLSQIKR
ncbi:hypothetical protein GJ496_007308 [Pomphorhynchus laevis]|nr:hypothetical protein GJ496_007308 [Pomphorhynchus laevis]